jgi:hypothetical protein
MVWVSEKGIAFDLARAMGVQNRTAALVWLTQLSHFLYVSTISRQDATVYYKYLLRNPLVSNNIATAVVTCPSSIENHSSLAN